MADAPQASAHNIFVGRQPIYDRDLNVHAYELLYRSSGANSAHVVDGDQATSQVILNTFVEIGLDTITGGHPAFINLTRSFMTGDHPLPFTPQQVVLECLEDIKPDSEAAAAIRRLADQGYTIALDDFVYRPEYDPMLEIAHVVKLEVMGLDHEQLEEILKPLRRFKLKLLAEKVETHEEFALCKELGFDYFQGYFFCKPLIIAGQRVPANRMAALQLMSRLQDPAVEFNELETLISRDVSLSYRLLRYINSALFSLPREVDSIRQAVVYMGQTAIRSWISLLIIAGIDDKPHELITTAMIRARMCERLAQRSHQPHTECYFTVGLFSALDALMNMPMPQLLDNLPLSAEVAAALLRHEGALGQALACVLAYEAGQWEQVNFMGLENEQYIETYIEAVNWAEQTSHELAD